MNITVYVINPLIIDLKLDFVFIKLLNFDSAGIYIRRKMDIYLINGESYHVAIYISL